MKKMDPSVFLFHCQFFFVFLFRSLSFLSLFSLFVPLEKEFDKMATFVDNLDGKGRKQFFFLTFFFFFSIFRIDWDNLSSGEEEEQEQEEVFFFFFFFSFLFFLSYFF